METKPSFQSHLSADLLEEYCFRRLGEAAADALEQHLLLCEECQDALQETEQYIRLMSAASAAGPILRHPHRHWSWRIASAALAAGMALLVFETARSSPPQLVSVDLVSFRGGAGALLTRAPAWHPIDLVIDDVAIEGADPLAGQYRVEVVTSAGKRAWEGAAKPLRGRLHASLPATLRRGLYWVRLYAAGPDPLYEYGLRLD